MGGALKGLTPFRQRLVVLMIVVGLFGASYLVLKYGGFTIEKEGSHLVMPVEVEFTSPVSRPTGLAWDGEALWVSSADDGAIIKLDPTTGETLATLSVGIESPWGMAWDGKHLWVADQETRQVFKVDTTSEEVTLSFPAPGLTPTGLTWIGESVIIADYESHEIYYLNSSNGVIIDGFDMPSPGYSPSGLAWDGEYLWIADMGASYVFMVDPVDGTVASYYYSSDYYPSDLAWADGYLWTLDYSTSKIFKTEPGVQYVHTQPVTVPSWFSLAFILVISPIILSLANATREEYPVIDPNEESRDLFDIMGIVLYIAAILSSIYTGYELFRIIYNVVFLNKIVYSGDNPFWVYKFEMLLCIFSVAYWVSFFTYRIIQLARKRGK